MTCKHVTLINYASNSNIFNEKNEWQAEWFLWLWYDHLINLDSEINEGNDEIGTVPGENWQEYLSNDIQVDGSNEVS